MIGRACDSPGRKMWLRHGVSQVSPEGKFKSCKGNNYRMGKRDRPSGYSEFWWGGNETENITAESPSTQCFDLGLSPHCLCGPGALILEWKDQYPAEANTRLFGAKLFNDRPGPRSRPPGDSPRKVRSELLQLWSLGRWFWGKVVPF